MTKQGLSISELTATLKSWQKKLNLDNWDISIQFVDFKRTDYKQSGDIKVYPEKSKAVILLTKDPFRNEETTIIHELVHLILWDYDIYNEKLINEYSNTQQKDFHSKYMSNLEDTVLHLTNAFIETSKSSK